MLINKMPSHSNTDLYPNDDIGNDSDDNKRENLFSEVIYSDNSKQEDKQNQMANHSPHSSPIEVHQCEDMLFSSQPCNHLHLKNAKTLNAPTRSCIMSHHKSSILSFSSDGDRVDALPKNMSFTWFDATAILFSIGSFLFDIGTDVAVAAFHYFNKDYWYFGLTIAFVMIPTLIMTGISMRWYVLDAREVGSPPISTCQWIMRFIFLMLQLGPILRYFDSLIYGLKFMQNKTNKQEQVKYFQYMIYEDTDATMLRLFECFMEAAPQLVLQLYILARSTPHGEEDHWTVVVQVAAVIASLVSLSWSLVSYQRSLRMSLIDKKNMTWMGIAIQFLWRLFVIAARVLALALFASEYRFYVSIVCFIHWVLMFGWIVTMKTSFCDNRYEELGYNAVVAVMFIFCYFNPVDSPTRFRYTAYYTFIFAENTVLMCLWYFKCSPDKWYRYPAMTGHFISFFIGLIFMAIYYLKAHPNGSVKVWRTQEDQEATKSKSQKQNGYKRESRNGLWSIQGRLIQGRLLHPRPAVPTIPNNESKNSSLKMNHRGKLCTNKKENSSLINKATNV